MTDFQHEIAVHHSQIKHYLLMRVRSLHENGVTVQLGASSGDRRWVMDVPLDQFETPPQQGDRVLVRVSGWGTEIA